MMAIIVNSDAMEKFFFIQTGHADHSGVIPCLGDHDWALKNIGQLPNMLADAVQKAERQPDTAANGDPIDISSRDHVPKGLGKCRGCIFDNAVRFGIRIQCSTELTRLSMTAPMSAAMKFRT